MEDELKSSVRYIGCLNLTLTVLTDLFGHMFVSVRHVCEQVGLSDGQTKSERLRLQNDAEFFDAVAYLPVCTEGGCHETLCIRLECVPLWLSRIAITPKMQADSSELASRLLKYRKLVSDAVLPVFISEFYPVKSQDGVSVKPSGKMTDFEFKPKSSYRGLLRVK